MLETLEAEETISYESIECLAVLTSRAMSSETRVHESKSPKLIGLQLGHLFQMMLAMNIQCGLVVPWTVFSKDLVETFVKSFPQTPTRVNPFAGDQSNLMFLLRNLQCSTTKAGWKGILHAHSTNSNCQWTVSITSDKNTADLGMSSWPDRLTISSYLDLTNPTVKAGLAAGVQLKLKLLNEKDLASWQQFIAKIKAKNKVGLVKWTPSAILLLQAINWDLYGFYIVKKLSSSSSDSIANPNDSTKKHQLSESLKPNPSPDSPQSALPIHIIPLDLNQLF